MIGACSRASPGCPDIASLHCVALREYRSHQVELRPGEVILGNHDVPVIYAEMVDRPARNGPVRQRDSQGTRDEFLPEADVAAASGLHHPAPHGAVRFDLAHNDPHEPSLRLHMPGGSARGTHFRRDWERGSVPRAGGPARGT